MKPCCTPLVNQLFRHLCCSLARQLEAFMTGIPLHTPLLPPRCSDVWAEALCCCAGDADVCEVLLRHPLQLDVANANQRTALHIAAAIGSAEVVQQLLDARAGTEVEDREGLTPCALAERRGHHVVASLISFAAISSSTVRPMQCS